jgi:hypothetical protein
MAAEDRSRFEAVTAEAFARLELGRGVYGAFDSTTDRRDLFREAELELLDAIVYAYLAILKLRAAREPLRTGDHEPRAAASEQAESGLLGARNRTPKKKEAAEPLELEGTP